MSKQTFAERCQLAQQLLPDAQYRVMLTKLHAEMLEALAEQPAQQEPVAYGMWDTMLGKDNRMMMVRLDNGQDGCTVPLYTTPQAQPAPAEMTEDQEQTMLKLCPHYGPSPARDQWIAGYEAAHGITKGNT